MNKITIIIMIIATTAISFSQSNYSLRSSVFGNSSNTAAGGNYEVRSTVGEPISASSSTSTNYSIKSGFWYTLQSVDVPSLSNPMAYETTGNSTSFSVEVNANGSSSTFGFEYGIASGDYSSGTFSADFGDNVNGSPLATGSATITGNITGLNPETTYYIRAFGENSTGSNTSTEVTFSTLSPEPVGHSTFVQVGEGLSSITFNYDRANDNSIKAEGYIIIRKSSPFTENDYPQDGTYYSANDPIGDAIVVEVIEDATATQTILNDLQKEQSWQFALIPFNTNIAQTSTNYLVSEAPAITGFTIPTLGEWGMIAFGGLMLVVSTWWVRRVV